MASAWVETSAGDAARIAEPAGTDAGPSAAASHAVQGRTVLVVFDLDGTITRQDTYLAFLQFVLRRRPTRLARCLHLPGSVVRFALGRLSNTALKTRLLTAVLGGLSRADAADLTEAFLARHFARLVKPQALQRIARHIEEGHRLVLITASLDVYSLALGARLGFAEVIATRIAWANDTITGDLHGANLRGEQKLVVLQELLATLLAKPPIIAYADHHSDLPLLRFADQGIAVDPTRPLAAAALQYGIRVESWLE